MQSTDITTLRELATRYAVMAFSEEQDTKRALWRGHNSFKPGPIPIYVRGIPFHEVPEVRNCTCEDAFYRGYELWFRAMLFQETVGDDYTHTPYVTVDAACVYPPAGIWGVEIKHTAVTEKGGSWMFDPPLRELDDIEKLIPPHHVIDEAETARRVEKLHDAIGDILPIAVDRAPVYRTWNADISTQLAHLRGLEQTMWDMTDNPEWLHRLLAFMRDGVLTAQAEAEAAGDWRLCAHQNQAMPYAEELADPEWHWR